MLYGCEIFQQKYKVDITELCDLYYKIMYLRKCIDLSKGICISSFHFAIFQYFTRITLIEKKT